MDARVKIGAGIVVLEAEGVGACGQEGGEGFEGGGGVRSCFEGDVAAVEYLAVELIADGNGKGARAVAGDEADFIDALLARGDGDGEINPAPAFVGGDGAIGVFLPREAGGKGRVEIEGGVKSGGDGVGYEGIGPVIVDLGSIAESVAIGIGGFGIGAKLVFHQVVEAIGIEVAVLALFGVGEAVVSKAEAIGGFPVGRQTIVIGIRGFGEVTMERGCGDDGAGLAGNFPGDGDVVSSNRFVFVEDLDIVRLASGER